MNRKVVAVILAAVFGLSIVTAVVLAITGGGGGDKVAGPATTTTTTAPLSPTAKELIERVQALRQRPLHLTYSGQLTSIAEAGTVTVEFWRKGKLVRQRIVIGAAANAQEQQAFVLPDGNVDCLKTPDADWRCQRTASVATAAGEPGGLIEAVVSQVQGKNVTVAKTTIGGTAVDCYTIEAATKDAICLRDDGVPVRFTLQGSEVNLTASDSKVTDADFVPPAKPADVPDAGTTTTGG
ncbi:MAG TPA: hypothetical protein VFJ85_00295 [Acidimicrobiales bacterium]|nr:hypothetical protein [Acidimicrobiales bacterium]